MPGARSWRPQRHRRLTGLAWIVISILSIATALNMLINPGPFGSQLPAVLSQFAAGATLFVWSMMPARGLAWGFGAWFGGKAGTPARQLLQL